MIRWKTRSKFLRVRRALAARSEGLFLWPTRPRAEDDGHTRFCKERACAFIMQFEANVREGEKWRHVNFQLKDDGAWSSEERSGFEVVIGGPSHAARGVPRAMRGCWSQIGEGTWVKEDDKIMFTVTSYNSSNSDARARKVDRTGDRFERSMLEVCEKKEFPSLFLDEPLHFQGPLPPTRPSARSPEVEARARQHAREELSRIMERLDWAKINAE
eukprot:s162_g22.t1